MAVKLERLPLGRRYRWTAPSKNLVRPVWQQVMARSEIVPANVPLELPVEPVRAKSLPVPKNLGGGERHALKLRPATPIAAFLGAPSLKGL